ncbi:nucleotidyltransferase domain-containing protein [Streptomyces seoulensis]|uniref:nucleotidyltransferase domain-containing protein n=1 Tax=Streptomyces seoulensis TaxID=73044 RepID=UPI001FCD357C|nr:nucleotidyltransferase domain-containing protein [Streptomyces seoulensis]
MSGPPVPHGLDAEGFIAREGSLARVQDAFRPVVAAARAGLTEAFGARLHSGYLYGSVPRGTARVGRSDLDLLVALRTEPADADRTAAADLGRDLDRRFPQIDGVGTLLYSRARLVSEAERYDLGWFLACLCTPLLGDDIAGGLPRYRPGSLLARETNGDLARLLPRWRERIAGAADTEEARRPLVRFMSRHLVRTGFTLVMPRWNGWTSELDEMAEVCGAYHPRRAAPMRVAARYGREPVGDAAILRGYVDDLGPWLAAEYARVHGEKSGSPAS